MIEVKERKKKGFPVLKFHSSNKKQLLAVIKYQLRGAKTLFLRVLTGVTLSVGMNYPELPTTKRRSKHQVKAAKKFYIQLLLQKYIKKRTRPEGGGGEIGSCGSPGDRVIHMESEDDFQQKR
jgi:hypothetical protein